MRWTGVAAKRRAVLPAASPSMSSTPGGPASVRLWTGSTTARRKSPAHVENTFGRVRERAWAAQRGQNGMNGNRHSQEPRRWIGFAVTGLIAAWCVGLSCTPSWAGSAVGAWTKTQESDASPEELLSRGDRLYEQERFDEAMALFKRAAEMAPDMISAHYRVARTAVEVRDPEVGLRAIENLVRLSPDLADDEHVRHVRAQLRALVESPSDPRPTPAADAQPRLTAEQALALRTAERILARGSEADGTAELKRIGEEALGAIRPMLLDPTFENLDVWRVAAAISVYTSDDTLAAHAFATIQRIRPDFHEDEQLLDLMVELNRPAVVAKAQEITERREGVLRHFQLAKEGDAHSQLHLGLAHAHGDRGVLADDDEAERWLLKASGNGNASASHKLAVTYERRAGTTHPGPGRTAAICMYRKAVEQGRSDSMRGLVEALLRVNLGSVDPETLAWAQSEPGQERGLSLLMAGYIADQGPESLRDPVRAIRFYRLAYEHGELDAMPLLGRRVRVHGLSANPHRDQSLYRWLKKHAELGDPDAMTTLGYLYQNGRGVPQDERTGYMWIKRAADLGHVPAMQNVGLCYSQGRGVVASTAQADRYLQRASRSGVHNANTFAVVSWYRRMEYSPPKGTLNTEDSRFMLDDFRRFDRNHSEDSKNNDPPTPATRQDFRRFDRDR